MAYALKSRFLSRSRSRLSISTVQKRTSRLSRKSRQFEKWCLDTSRSLDLDLDWSRQSRPPSLSSAFQKYIIKRRYDVYWLALNVVTSTGTNSTLTLISGFFFSYAAFCYYLKVDFVSFCLKRSLLRWKMDFHYSDRPKLFFKSQMRIGGRFAFFFKIVPPLAGRVSRSPTKTDWRWTSEDSASLPSRNFQPWPAGSGIRI